MADGQYSRSLDLYGPLRTHHADVIKRTLLQTSVLPPGEYNYTQNDLNQQVWRTSAHIPSKLLARKPDQPIKLRGKNLEQLCSHFRFGNDSGGSVPARNYSGSVTKQDFHLKNVPKPWVEQADPTVNWPDVAPQYTTDRSTGSTEYRGAFLQTSLSPSSPSYPRPTTSDVDTPRADMRNVVNVTLGTDRESFKSETGASYSASPDGHQRDLQASQRLVDVRQATERMRDMEHNSNVFRYGDYNNLGKDREASIFTLDYCRKSSVPCATPLVVEKERPLSGEPEDENEEEEEESIERLKLMKELNKPQDNSIMPSIVKHYLKTRIPHKPNTVEGAENDYTTTHFKFGTDAAGSQTMYGSDFLCDSQLHKPRLQPPPRDSQVLERDDLRPTGQTVNTAQFPGKTIQMSRALNHDIRDSATGNTTVRHGDHFSLGYDVTYGSKDRQSSLAKASYIPPPSTFRPMTPRRAETSAYNYLETEVALPHDVPADKRSETQYNYGGNWGSTAAARSRHCEDKEANRGRLQQGKGTHFDLGYQTLTYDTEKSFNFQGHGNSGGTPAAGIIESPPDTWVDHLAHSQNARDVMTADPHAARVADSLWARSLVTSRHSRVLPGHVATCMQNDYQPMVHRMYTPAQLLMLHQDHKLSKRPIATSHLFHTVPKGLGIWSTTRADYMAPSDVTVRRPSPGVTSYNPAHVWRSSRLHVAPMGTCT